MQQTNNSPELLFKEPKPALIRIWHWLAVLFFFASLTTVIFGSTLFRTGDNISMVQEQAQQKGGNLTKDQAWSIAHEYSDKLWMLHKYIGFGLAALLLFRVVIRFKQPGVEKNLRGFRKSFENTGNSPEVKHFLLVHYGYRIFYVLFVIMATTGLILAFEDVSWLKVLHEPAEVIHSWTQWGMYAYMLLHIIGVLRADIGKYGGIVSRMINGKSSS